LALLINKEKKEFLILYAIVGVIVVIAYFYLILKPQVVGLISSFSQSGKLKKELSDTITQIKAMDGLKKQLDGFKSTQEYQEKKLPMEKEIPALLEGLSQTAKARGVKIVSIKPLEPQAVSIDNKPAVYTAVPIDVTVRCGYHELGYFINNLEDAERFMKIEEITVEADSNNPRIHNIKILVYSYILQEK